MTDTNITIKECTGHIGIRRYDPDAQRFFWSCLLCNQNAYQEDLPDGWSIDELFALENSIESSGTTS